MSQTIEIVQSLCSHNATYRAPTKESTFRFVLLIVLCEILFLRKLDCNFVITCVFTKEVPFCSVETGEDVDLEVLVDDFLTFYMAGEQNPINYACHFGCQLYNYKT